MQTREQGKTVDYITRTFVREPDYIATARAAGERRHPGMQISSYEGHLLRWLVQISGAASILEIGTFMGVSTLWMAEGLPPSDGRIISLEYAAEHAEEASAHVTKSPHHQSIEVIHTNAHQWIEKNISKHKFNMVFIDAEKKGYADYLEAVLPHLNPRGWVIGDNTLLFGALSGENPGAANADSVASMKKFNETLADGTRFESVLLPTAEGLTVARLRG